MSTFIFGYGSLINIESLKKTINRKLEPSEIFAVQLMGYTRLWNYKASVFSTELDREIEAVYLNIAPFHNAFINGIVFEVSDEELEQLKKRERFYSMVDVTSNITFNQEVKIYTFICYDRRHLAEFGSQCYILEKYIGIVEDGCLALGNDFHATYHQTTQPFPFEIVPGDYRFIG